MFLKPIMLAGLGAAVLPLVLHLLSKARYRTVEWGAMMFLEPPTLRTGHSSRLKQALILILRTGIIATLAIALARPVLRAGTGAAAEDTRIHAIVVLDRSASMGFSENGRSRFADAKQAVINILSTLHRGDEVSLVLTGDAIDPGQVQPTSDLQSIATRVSALQPSRGQADVAAALEQVRQALSREPNITHELYVVCDRQACSWENINDRFAAQWQKMQQDLPSSLRFFLVPVGGDESDNLAVESIRLPGPPAVRDIPANVEVHLRNYGQVPRSDLPLTILSNGEPVAHSSVNLAADSTSVVTVPLKFSSSGPQVLSAKVETTGFRFDDEIDLATTVLEPARVLIISGEPRSGSLRSSADYVRLALAPHEASRTSGVDPASVRIIGVDDWWGISPDRDDVLILTNIGQLSDDQIRQLEQFIYGGGGLIFAPGDLTDLHSASADLYRNSEGFLPGTFKTASHQPATALRVAQFEANHPMFEFLHGHLDLLGNTSITRFLDLDEHSADTRIIATLTGGKPFLVERPYGRGRVLMFTTTLGTEWNRLPMTSMYLPLLQSAVRYLAGANLPDRNLKAFEPIELSLDRALAQPIAIVTLPSGAQRRVQPVQSGSRWTIRFVDTAQPGRYLLSFGGSTLGYVVTASHGESDPTPLTVERSRWLQSALNFRTLEGDKPAMTAAVNAQRSGTELHLPLLGMVVLLAIGELALTRIWSR